MVRPGIILLLCLMPAVSPAHDVDITGVARMFLDELEPGQYNLSVVDRQVPPLYNLEGVIPTRCSEGVGPDATSHFQCPTPLSQDDRMTLPWSLEGLVVIARWHNGESGSAYFRGNGAQIEIRLADLKAGSGSLAGLAWTYLVSGAEHILFGFDHLLFVLGLLLLLRGVWPLVKTITAFTVAHSFTLGLAVLGVVNVPSAPVEVIIALSIVLLAREVVMGQRRETSLVHRRPWLIALLFGLVHGLGFAGALGELGLQAADIPIALLFFNLGVEAGQLGFIALVLLAYALVRRPLATTLPAAQTAVAYGLGGIAMYWFVQRLPGLIPV